MKNVTKSISVFFILTANILAFSEYNANERPSAETTEVKVRYFLTDLLSIDNIDQSFTADFFLRLDWKDPRLINQQGQYSLNEVWHPKIQIHNSRDTENQLPETVSVKEDGTVTYMQRIFGTFTSHFDFKKFPFDTQTLSISFLSILYSSDEVSLVLDNGGKEEKLSIAGWAFESDEVFLIPTKFKFDGGEKDIINRAAFTYSVEMKREILFYWYKVVAPMVIIVFLSWAVFFIDPSQVGPQIGVSATSILTLIAFLLRLENIIPPISYLTRLDYFVFLSLFLVFLAYVEALISTYFALNEKKYIALKMDLISRFIFPGMFFLVLFLYWVI